MDAPKPLRTAAALVSLVVPVFNEEDGIAPFLKAVGPVLDAAGQGGVTVEILFVDDGSADATVARVLAAQTTDRRIRAVGLSRNFGKEAAITAGLDEARGDAVILMDVDLQDPPELIGEMIARWREGAEVVLARRADRSDDTPFKRLTAGWFYALHNRISRTRIPANVGDFRLMDRVVVEAMKLLPENRRFMKGLFAWVGFNTVHVDYKRPARATGTTKFSGWRLWRLALEGITSFSSFPLVVWTYVGSAISILALGFGIYIIVKTLMFGVDTPGYASTLVVVLFLGGIQLLGIGILGEYVGRMYDEVKRRPPYVIGRRYDLPEAKAAPRKARTPKP